MNVDGVQNASGNPATKKKTVKLNPAIASIEASKTPVEEAGYSLLIPQGEKQAAHEPRQDAAYKRLNMKRG